MDVTLTVESERELGTRPSRRLRHAGKVPAVVYGLGREPRSVAVNWPDLRKAITTEAGLNALITLEVDGEQNLTIIKDLQRHPVKRTVLHVDFQLIDRDRSPEGRRRTAGETPALHQSCSPPLLRPRLRSAVCRLSESRASTAPRGGRVFFRGTGGTRAARTRARTFS